MLRRIRRGVLLTLLIAFLTLMLLLPSTEPLLASACLWEAVYRWVLPTATPGSPSPSTAGSPISAVALTQKSLEAGVEGYVFDARMGAPLRGVRVRALPKYGNLTSVETVTDEAGRYLLSLVPGEYVLVVLADHYADWSEELSLPPGEVRRIDFKLEPAVAEFPEDWDGVKFELAIVGNLTWEVGADAVVKVLVTVSSMGRNREVEFKLLELNLLDSAVSGEAPVNVRFTAGGSFAKEVRMVVLYGLELIAPGRTVERNLLVTLKGSIVDEHGASWPGLAIERVVVKVYAPESPVLVEAEFPARTLVGEEFDVKLKLRNCGVYPIYDLDVALEYPIGVTAVTPLRKSTRSVEPGEVFEVAFRLRAEGALTSYINVTYSYRTFWGYYVLEPPRTLGSVTIVKVPTSITVSVEPRQVAVGGTISVRGSITPAMTAPVVLIVKEPDGVTQTFNTVSYLDGTFTFSVKLTKVGRYTLVAVFQGDAKYEASITEEVYTEAVPTPAQVPLWLYAVVACVVVVAVAVAFLLRRGR